MTTDDPIVAEVRAIRHALAARYDHDVERLLAAVKAQARKSGRETIRYPSRPASRKPSQRRLAGLHRSRVERG